MIYTSKKKKSSKIRHMNNADQWFSLVGCVIECPIEWSIMENDSWPMKQCIEWTEASSQLATISSIKQHRNPHIMSVCVIELFI